MATGGYRTSSGGTSTTTTDFLEEWKAKREKMRAKHNPQGQMMVPSAVGGGGGGVGNEGVSKLLAGALGAPSPSASPATLANEFNNNHPPRAPAPANPAPGGANYTLTSSSVPAPARVSPEPRKTEEEQLPTTSAAGVAPGAPPMSHTLPSGSRASPDLGAQPSSGDREDRDYAKEKGKSSGPSARKGKGQIEKRKLREKRRSTGVVNIPATEGLDEYEDDEEGQKERKREDTITQQNTKQNEAAASDPGGSSLLVETSKSPSSRRKSATVTPEDDFLSRNSRSDKKGSRHSKDLRISPNLLEKKIEELEREVIREKQENQKLQKMIQDKEEVIGKLREEIDLLNRDLDDTEDENEQLKQENKTLLKVVGQLTR